MITRQVSSGGMQVHGGLTIHSGGLTLDNQPYTVGTLHTTNIDTNLNSPVISAASNSAHYAGSMLELTAVVVVIVVMLCYQPTTHH